ncbi:hypothetical protein Acr_26g0001180 [Actinidia rufa]|uniref:Uncharacterized protein n=1 Tax=Actinidia rufa TaxID=165716 RepID=A0A7J0H1F7_9ERIC|nr:hypothetical protein Acr_26g0001180 [Actinidia rufa]
MLELQSGLEGCDSCFVNVFVKGLGFLVRYGFQKNRSSFRFSSPETHPFVKGESTGSLESRYAAVNANFDGRVMGQVAEIAKDKTMEMEDEITYPRKMGSTYETINEVTDLDVTPAQSLEATDSDNLIEMVKPKVAEDFNQEFESSPMTKTLEEAIQRAVEKLVYDSSSVSEVSEEKINNEDTEDTDHYDGETTTTIGKTEDACTKKDNPEFDNLKLEETSGMVFQLLGTESKSANNVTIEKSDADEVKVEEKETLDVVSEAKDTDSDGAGREAKDKYCTINSIYRSPKIEFDISSFLQDLVELSTIGNESKRDEANIHSTTDDNEDEKTQNLNEIPNLLSDAKDTEVSLEGDTMDFADINEITKDTKDWRKPPFPYPMSRLQEMQIQVTAQKL